jgi:hydrogenase maturation protease
MKTLILGMGNTLLRDDGVGIAVKRYLERRLYDRGDVHFEETSWGGFRIIDLLKDYDYAIIVDAIRTLEKPAGYVHHLKPTDLLPTLRLTSYHDLNFITALNLADTMGIPVPSEIDIFAIEVEDNYTISEGLTAGVARAVEKCAEEVIQRLERITRRDGSATRLKNKQVTELRQVTDPRQVTDLSLQK